MALNPNISLEAGRGVTQFDPVGSAQKGLSLRQLATTVQYQPQVLEASLAAQRASTAATEQQTAEQGRQQAGSRRIAEIVRQNTTVDKATGKILKDNRAIADLAAAEGLPVEVVFKYTSDAVRNEADQFKTDADKDTYLRNQAFLAANLMRNARTPEEAMNIARGFQQGDAKVVGEERTSAFYRSLFSGMDPNSDPREAARTVSTSLAISELQERNLIPGGTSSEQMRPDSRLNARDRALLKSLGIEVPPTTTREQLQNLEPFKKFIGSTIAGEGTVVAGIEEAGQAAAMRVPYQEAIAAERDVRSIVGTQLGSRAQALWNRYIEQDPRYAQVQAAIDDYNARNKTNISIGETGVDGVFARLKTEDRRLRSVQDSGAAKATNPNLRRAAEGKVSPELQAERDRDRVRILQDEYERTTSPVDRAALERELKKIGAAPRAKNPTGKGSPKDTVRVGKGGVRYVKINDGPDNVRENWKAQ